MMSVGIMKKERKCEECPYWKDTQTESGCSAPFSCKDNDAFDEFMWRADRLANDYVPMKGYDY